MNPKRVQLQNSFSSERQWLLFMPETELAITYVDNGCIITLDGILLCTFLPPLRAPSQFLTQYIRGSCPLESSYSSLFPTALCSLPSLICPFCLPASMTLQCGSSDGDPSLLPDDSKYESSTNLTCSARTTPSAVLAATPFDNVRSPGTVHNAQPQRLQLERYSASLSI